MKKRLLSMLLAAVMLLGMVPAAAFAQDSELPSLPVCLAAYAADVTVDGTLSEAEWVMNGRMTSEEDHRRFGALWVSGKVYFALELDSADAQVTLILNGREITVTKSGVSGIRDAAFCWTEGVLELGIPTEAAGFAICDYTQRVPLEITVGENKFLGELGFSSTVRTQANLRSEAYTESYYYGSVHTGDYDFADSTPVEDGYRMELKAASLGYNYYDTYHAVPANMDLSSADGPVRVEFDLNVESMTEVGGGRFGSLYPTSNCMVLWLCDGNGWRAPFSVYLSSSDKLLYLGYACAPSGGTNAAICLDKALNDTFRLGIDLRGDGTGEVFVDGISKGRIQNIYLDKHMDNAKNMLYFRAFNGATSKTDTIFTFSGVAVGSGMGGSILDQVNFEAIKGSNLSDSAVISNLQLPASLTNSQLGTQAITWTSSMPEVIGTDGSVTRNADNNSVIMTAALTDYPDSSKEILLTVPRLFAAAYGTMATPTLDGVMEGIWKESREFGLRQGATTGKVSALWNQSSLYLAVTYTNATHLRITLGSKEWNIPLSAAISTDGVTGAAQNGVAELVVPLDAAGIRLKDYGESHRIGLTLTDEADDANRASLEAMAIDLDFMGGATQVEIDLNDARTSGLTYSALKEHLEIATDGACSRKYWILQNVANMDRGKDLYLEQRLAIENLPVSRGWVGNGVAQMEGYGFWLADTTADGGDVMCAVVYNAGSGALKLKVVKGPDNAAANLVDVDLNKQVGDSFTLGTLWKADGTLVITVDGTVVQTIENVCWSMGKGAVGIDSIALNYYQTVSGKAKISVSDLVFKSQENVPVVYSGSLELKDMTLSGAVGFTPNAQDKSILELNTTATGRQYWIKQKVPGLDHSRDLLLEQQLTVTNLPQSDGYVGGGVGSMRGYGFWIADSTSDGGDVACANLYNNGTGLVLRVIRESNASWQDVPLEKKNGDSFKLGLLWRADNTAEIYVDGQLVDTVSNVCWVVGPSTVGVDSLAFNHVQQSARQVTLAVSGVKISVLGNDGLLVNDTTHNIDMSKTTSPNQVAASGFTFSSATSAALKVSASETAARKYLLINGYTGFDHSKDMLLEQTLTFNKLTAAASAPTWGAGNTGHYMVFLGCGTKLSTNDYASVIIYNAGNGALSAWVPTVKATQKDGVTIPLGKNLGDTFTFGFRWNADNSVQLYVDGIQVGDTVPSFAWPQTGLGNNAICLNYRKSGASDEADIAVSDLKLTVRDSCVPAATEQRFSFPGKATTTFTQADVKTHLDIAPTTTGELSRDYWISKNNSILNHRGHLLLEQTVNVSRMAQSNGDVGSGLTKMRGYYFWLADTDAEKTLACANLFNNADGSGLTLRVITGPTNASYKDIPLDRQEGSIFKLGFRWDANGTVSVYVDGILKGQAENVNWETTACAGVPGSVGMNYYQMYPTGEDYLSISDVTLTAIGYDSLAEELALENLLPGLDRDNITDSFPIPRTYDSPYLGTVDLFWESSSEAITVKADGTARVSRPGGRIPAYVFLTLTAFGDRKVYTEEVRVAALQEMAPQNIPLLNAAFTADPITVDGEAETGWHLNSQVLSGGVAGGSFGAQWDMNNLYLLFKTDETLKVILNGRSVDPVSVKTAAYTEMQISLADLGVTVLDYGQQIAARIEMGAFVWDGIIELTSTDWFISDTVGSGIGKSAQSAYTNNSNPASVEFNSILPLDDNGYYFYDHYVPGSQNAPQMTSYIQLGTKNEKDAATYAPLGDMTRNNYLEFDLYFENMPVWAQSANTNISRNPVSYAFNYFITGAKNSNGEVPSISVGIINTGEGLLLMVHDFSDGETYRRVNKVMLGKSVGDTFRLGTRWNTEDGSVSIFVDDRHIADFSHVAALRAMDENKVQMQICRNKDLPDTSNDNMDIYVTNIAIGKSYGDSVFDGLDFNAIKGENTDPYKIISNLQLPGALGANGLGLDDTVTWESDNDAIKNDGTVTVPESAGVPVNLTARLSNGAFRTFRLYVPAANPVGLDTMAVTEDSDTANGAGIIEDLYRFRLDESNNSVILDLGESRTINVITLTDGDTVTRLNESSLSIWVSDDNVSYKRVEGGFKLLRMGEKTYLYEFTAQGRYIKVHCTHYYGAEADFEGPLQGMLKAEYQTVFGDNGSAFHSEIAVTVTNTADYTRYDDAFSIPRAEAVADGAADASIRVFLGDELLYHYVDGDSIVVRIPEIAAGGSVELKVLSGNADAMDIANKEYVHEIIYGTREMITLPNLCRYFEVLPNGALFTATGYQDPWNVGKDEGLPYYTTRYVGYSLSYDGGITWTDHVKIAESYGGGDPEVLGWMSGMEGVLYDPTVGENGRLIITGFTSPGSGLVQRFMYSDDLCQTWHRSNEAVFDANPTTYFLGYTSPIRLSTADGDGPGVDYVMPVGSKDQREDAISDLACRVMYSTDAGISWRVSATVLTNADAQLGIVGGEGGMSEASIMECDDGRLVLYCRNQGKNETYFVRAYSDDKGITWGPVELSDVFTVNTQPMLYNYGDQKLLFWSGNNSLGGESGLRYPLSVAVSNDDWKTFGNIQDLFNRYSLQGMVESYCFKVTNPDMVVFDETLTIAWNNHGVGNTIVMRVDDFYNFLFRTKGAYDSFENSTSKYEGWTTTSGVVEASTDRATDGEQSMKVSENASAVRSIPYVQDGNVTFDLFVENAATANFTLELQAAFNTTPGKASAPISLEVKNGVLSFRRSDTDTGIALKDGWNKVSFRLDLAADTPSAELTVNGTAARIPLQGEAFYVCYVYIMNSGTKALYMDAFLVTDTMQEELPDKPHSPIKTDKVDSTCMEEGTEAYWTCKTCGKVFADGLCKQEVKPADLVIPKKEHTWDEAFTYDDTHHWHKCLTEGCTAISEKEEHSSVGGKCECGHCETALPKISGNLSLNETIDINFIIPAIVDMTDAVLVVKNAATGEDVDYETMTGIGGTTVVRYSAKANHMTDEITVQVFDAEGNPLTQMASMSVRKYAGIRFAVAEETEKMMLIRMLDYGALAQINSGVTTDLANSIVTDELRAFANAYDWADAVQLEVPAGSGGVFKAGLALNETIDVTVYTAATNVAEGDNFVVKCNGEELSEEEYIVKLLDDGRYVIRYSVKSNEMSDEIYIAIVGEDNTVKAETTLGVRIYAQKFLAAVSTGNQAAMLLAMLDYGTMAQLYAGTNTDDLANCFVSDTMRQVLISYPWP